MPGTVVRIAARFVAPFQVFVNGMEQRGDVRSGGMELGVKPGAGNAAHSTLVMASNGTATGTSVDFGAVLADQLVFCSLLEVRGYLKEPGCRPVLALMRRVRTLHDGLVSGPAGSCVRRESQQRPPLHRGDTADFH
jgi:hypothetical protein